MSETITHEERQSIFTDSRCMTPVSSGSVPMSQEFIPPFPARFPVSPPEWRRLLVGRKNFLAMWEEEAFELEFSSARVFCRKTFLCNSPASVQFAFSKNNHSFERKAPQMRFALKPLLGNGLFISDGETWRARRRAVAPIIHANQLPRFAEMMVKAAVETGRGWQSRMTDDGIVKLDMLAEMAHLTANIISRTVFGNELAPEYSEAIVSGFSEYQSVIGQIDPISLLGFPDWFPRFYRPAVLSASKRIHDVIDRIIANIRRRRTPDDRSLIGQLLNARDENGNALSNEAVRDEAVVLFMAGHETTANTLAWVWFILSQMPQHEAALHDELTSVLKNRTPALADVPKLEFTRAVIEETLRLYPPVPILPREALRDEEFQGEAIPRGSLIFVVPWLLHRHKKLWDKPDHFIPERFLPEPAKLISKFAYVPFSVGPRVCAGMTFALTESILCLATLAQKFSIELEPGHVVEPVCRLTLRPAGGLPMIVALRDPVAVT
jgi:cytochrome P450